MVDFKQIEKTIKDTAKEEKNFIPVLSNAAAAIFQHIPGVNWVGFYIADADGFYLGPFQGKVRTPRIPSGKGLCSLSSKKNDMIYVPDVHEQSDYISGDPATDCEVVFPLHADDKVIAVLLIDSPILNRFPVGERDSLRRLAGLIEKSADFSSIAGALPAAAKKAPAKEHSMPFELWLYAIKGLAQTYEMVEPIYSQLSEQEKKALQDEYEKST